MWKFQLREALNMSQIRLKLSQIQLKLSQIQLKVSQIQLKSIVKIRQIIYILNASSRAT